MLWICDNLCEDDLLKSGKVVSCENDLLTIGNITSKVSRRVRRLIISSSSQPFASRPTQHVVSLLR